MMPFLLSEIPPPHPVRCDRCGERIEPRDDFGRSERICRGCRRR